MKKKMKKNLVTGHEVDAVSFSDGAVDDAEVDNDASVGVVVAVEDQGGQGAVSGVGGRGDLLDHRVQDLRDADAFLGGAEKGVGAVEADDLFDLADDAVGVGAGEVDFVEDLNPSERSE